MLGELARQSLFGDLGDVGVSIPALWATMNAMRPMTKSQADQLLAAASASARGAAAVLSGSDATKAAAHADACDDTRISVSNVDQDPLEEGIASGVRTMAAQGLAWGNQAAETNAALRSRVSALWSDIKANAAEIPHAIGSAAASVVGTTAGGFLSGLFSSPWTIAAAGVGAYYVFVHRKRRA